MKWIYNWIFAARSWKFFCASARIQLLLVVQFVNRLPWNLRLRGFGARSEVDFLHFNLIVLAVGWRGILFISFTFGDEKKIPEFFTAIFGPKLHVIIINNYWAKHNIE